MPPDKKQIAKDCFKKGSEVMAKESWDFAIEMIDKAVALDPENLLYRQTLRGCEGRKYGNNGSGARMAGVKLMKVRGQIKKLRLQKDWRAIDRAAEQGLKINPWDPQLNADLAQACHEVGFDEVAVWAYQKALEKDPDNLDFHRQLAAVLEERGSYDEAGKHWEKILKEVPLDAEARTKISHLEAKSVMDHGGYEDAKTTRDVKEEEEVIESAYDLDRPTKRVLPEAVEGPGVSLEADLRRAVKKEPNNKSNYLKLGDYYKRQKQLDKAAKVFQEALDLSSEDDPDVRELLEDVQILQLKQKIEVAKQAVEKNPDNERFKQRLTDLQKELVRKEIEAFVARVKHYPKDTTLKYQLARRYMMFSEWAQAIPLLQQCTADQRIECEVGVCLGECFVREKKLNLAQRQFERVVDKIDPHNKADLFKKCHYSLGRLCEEAGQRDVAEQHYNEILAVDYEYRDVLKRLEEL